MSSRVNDGRSRSPSRAIGEAKTPSRSMSQRERFLSPGGGREGTQDAAILQSVCVCVCVCVCVYVCVCVCVCVCV